MCFPLACRFILLYNKLNNYIFSQKGSGILNGDFSAGNVMKNYKVFSLLVAVVMAFSLLSFSVYAQEPSSENTSETTKTEPTTDTSGTTDPTAPAVSGDWKYKSLTDSTVEIVEYIGKATECVVPESIEGKKVTALASGVVKNSEITSVVIPGSVTTLPADSFIGCPNLKTFTVLTGSLTSFNIEYCSNLEVINLPESIKTIGVFEQCPMIHSINVAEKNAILKSVDGVVYSKDGKILLKYPAGKIADRFVVPSTVTTISDYAFYGTKGNVKEIFIPSSVVKMDNNAFKDSIPTILFAADKLPTGCEAAVKGKNVKLNQINIYAPVKVVSAENQNAIKLTWQKVAGADGYAVYYKNAKGWKHYKNLTANSITFTKLKACTKYTFAIRSVVKTSKGLVASPNYITFQTSTTPVATAKIANAKNDSAIKLSWEKVKNADGYAIYYKNSKGWKHYKNTTATTITFKNLKGYTNYTFAVRSLVKTTDKIVAGAYRAVTVRTNLATPTVSAQQQKNTQNVYVTWTPSVGASHYQVYYKVNGSDWMLLATYDEVVKAKIPNLPKGIKLTFAVRALRSENGKITAKSAYKPVDLTVK